MGTLIEEILSRKAGHDVHAGEIVFFFPGIIPGAKDDSVFYCKCPFIPCTREGVEYLRVFEYCIRGCIAPGCIDVVRRKNGHVLYTPVFCSVASFRSPFW